MRTEETGVEPDTELSDQVTALGAAARLAQLLQKFAGSRLGYCAQVLHQVVPRHAHPSVDNVEDMVFFVRLENKMSQGS